MVVTVVGSGAAGLLGALAAHARGVPVRLITDRNLGTSNSVLAQGGMQLPLDEASEQRMAIDMRRSARVDLDSRRLNAFVQGIRPMAEELRSLGLKFDRDDDGALVRRRAGGLSEPRVVSVGDRIGAPLIKCLTAAIRAQEIEVQERCPVRTIEQTTSGLRLVTEDGVSYDSAAVVCATGGSTWAQASKRGEACSNPRNANHRLADHLRTEHSLVENDPARLQYQPYGDVSTLRTDGPGKLIPETLGHRLPILDRDGNTVIAPGAGRLATTEAMRLAFDAGRAVESKSGVPGFILPLSELDPASIADTHPTLHRRLRREQRLGRDIVIAPFAHYQLGGFTTDISCGTDIPGLFLAGEMVGGLHGRDRLMGNALTDSLVHGRRAGQAAAEHVMSCGR